MRRFNSLVYYLAMFFVAATAQLQAASCLHLRLWLSWWQFIRGVYGGAHEPIKTDEVHFVQRCIVISFCHALAPLFLTSRMPLGFHCRTFPFYPNIRKFLSSDEKHWLSWSNAINGAVHARMR